jgi:hypothetical protein
LGSIQGRGHLAGFVDDEQEADVHTADVEIIQAVAGIDDVEVVEETSALLATVYLLAQLNVTTLSPDPRGYFFNPSYRALRHEAWCQVLLILASVTR